MSFGIQSIGILELIYPGETYHGPVQLGGEATWKDNTEVPAFADVQGGLPL